MDVIDILGGLLRGKKGTGKGPDFSDVFGQGSRTPTRKGGRGEPSAGASIESQAKELEDLLGVARERNTRRQNDTGSRPQSQSPVGTTLPPQDIPGESHFSPRSPPAPSSDGEAMVLILAMLNAAKADGKLSPAEQQNILRNLDGDARDAHEFLREELSKPLDVREFVWSVPIGLEQKVYAMSLVAIDVDTEAERKYLRDLAHGLRLSPDVCEQLHRRFGARTAP